jgi:hypothetical protein
MNRLLVPTRVDVSKPVMQFFEDGPWLRIESPGQPTRYLGQKEATELLIWLGQNSETLIFK